MVLCLVVFALLGAAILTGFIQSWPLTAGSAGAAAAPCAPTSPSPAAGPTSGPSASPVPGAAVPTPSGSPGPTPSPTPTGPSPSPSASPGSFVPACVYGFIDLPATPDIRFLTLVAFAGALGGVIYTLRSFVMFAGNRTLVTSWLPLYVVSPFVGALLGVVFYVLLRAGIVSSTASTVDISPYGFAAVAALGGLFAAQALEKLKVVFEDLFTKLPESKDPLVQPQPPKISTMSPTHARQGETVTITGSGLAGVTSILFGKAVATPSRPPLDTITQVVVPGGAEDGPVKVVSATGDQAQSPQPFHLDPE